jgi:DNA (cytosine-5)-methyltransferase 1
MTDNLLRLSGRKPRLLDLFCGAGGAAMGYHRAGFDVVGVDIEPQPHYPFEFRQMDALELLGAMVAGRDVCKPVSLPNGWGGLDAIHASPPCQFHTTMSARWRGKGMDTLADQRVDLLTPTLAIMRTLDLPWVVENVEGAAKAMRTTLKLHGGMFGLGVHRPRLFESNVMMLMPREAKALSHVGVYGRAPDGRKLSKSSECYAPSSLKEAQEAMGMDWADWHGTKEAIPPAYTEFIGSQLIQSISLTLRKEEV